MGLPKKDTIVMALSMPLRNPGRSALTAIGLMFAIFRYKPSPFCILNEVDAPLDEANIDRFVEVLKQFMQWREKPDPATSQRTNP